MKVEAELRNAQHENKTDAALIEIYGSIIKNFTTIIEVIERGQQIKELAEKIGSENLNVPNDVVVAYGSMADYLNRAR